MSLIPQKCSPLMDENGLISDIEYEAFISGSLNADILPSKIDLPATGFLLSSSGLLSALTNDLTLLIILNNLLQILRVSRFYTMMNTLKSKARLLSAPSTFLDDSEAS
jgi:hypothetical protein